MRSLEISAILLLYFLIFTGISCTESEEQQQFERQALQPPGGITAMDANGMPVEDGENDPDDWRTAPEFSGLIGIEITPAYPNPVQFNSFLNLEINVQATEFVDGLYTYVIQNQGNPKLLRREDQTSTSKIYTYRIKIDEFAQNAGTGFGDYYRIIIRDRNGAIISYGDVLINTD